MKKVIFASSNPGKNKAVEERNKGKKVKIKYAFIDSEELETNDIAAIAIDKAEKAYDMYKQPCFVIDNGFYIVDYPDNPGYPGTFVKRSGIANNPEKLLKKMKKVENRKAYFVDCLAFYDGNEYKVFFSNSIGTISDKIRGELPDNAKSKLWQVFIPEGNTKTLAEMTNEELSIHRKSKESATDEFLEWYQNEYEVEKPTKKTFTKTKRNFK